MKNKYIRTVKAFNMGRFHSRSRKFIERVHADGFGLFSKFEVQYQLHVCTSIMEHL